MKMSEGHFHHTYLKSQVIVSINNDSLQENVAKNLHIKEDKLIFSRNNLLLV